MPLSCLSLWIMGHALCSVAIPNTMPETTWGIVRRPYDVRDQGKLTNYYYIQHG